MANVFRVGQRIRFNGVLADILSENYARAVLRVYDKPPRDITLPWNEGRLTPECVAVRGRPFVKGADDRRRDSSKVPQSSYAAKVAESATNAGALAKVLEDLIAKAGSAGPLDEAKVIAILTAEAAKQQWGRSATVTVTVDGVPHTFDGTKHHVLDRILPHAVQRRNILVVGPAGCGKTTLGEQVALSLFGSTERFASISCSPGMGESAWLGRVIPNLSTGQLEYHETPFVQAVRNGGVFLADELDNSDASTILVLNSVLANGHITLPNGERLKKSKDFVFIASANTYGHGQSREYVGRSQLDAAFLDRFVGSTIEMDYDRTLEAVLCPETEILEKVHAIRDKVAALKLRRLVSTRAILAARDLVLGQRQTLPQALAAITTGWSEADKKAVGV